MPSSDGRRFHSPNFNQQEMRIHAESSAWLKNDQQGDDSMEFPPYPNDEDNDIVQVFNLYHIKIDEGGHASRPLAIPFSSMKKLKKHVVEMIKKCDRLDKRFVVAVEAYGDHFENVDRIIETFRMAEVANSKPLGFDVYWEEEPQVLL